MTGEAFTRWRKAVLDRDGWRCRRCNSGYNLHVHHIRKRSDLRLDTMENGITLCEKCHRQVERQAKPWIVILSPDEEPIDANKQVVFRYTEVDSP